MAVLATGPNSRLTPSSAVIVTMISYGLASGFLLANGNRDYPEFHTLLDASIFLLSGILALFFWNLSLHQADLPNMLAASFIAIDTERAMLTGFWMLPLSQAPSQV